MKFGTLELEHVLTAPLEHDWQEVEVAAPYREVDYRREQFDLGRTVTVTGEIREANKDDAAAKKDALRSLSDGITRLLDFEDGETTLYAKLGEVVWAIKAEDDWYPGECWIGYKATFLECNFITTTDTVGDDSNSESGYQDIGQGTVIIPSASGILQTIGINIQNAAGNLQLSIYSDFDEETGEFSGLLGESAITPAVNGWNDLAILGYVPLIKNVPVYLWVNNDSTSLSFYWGTDSAFIILDPLAFGTWPDPTPPVAYYGSTDGGNNMRITYAG